MKPPTLLLDLTHTCHTRARTGIQRVARSLLAALGDAGCAITHDPHLRRWRELESWERANLAADTPARARGAQWPLAARARGFARRKFGRTAPPLPASRGLIVVEVFSPSVARALPALFAEIRGPRVAVFHDAIALQFPELTPPGTVARFPAYLVELLEFDGIAAVSEDSRQTLIDYWQWLGVGRTPPVFAIPLGLDIPATEPTPIAPGGPPVVLTVASIEGRKNHVALLEACEILWGRGRQFSLHLIGLAHAQTGAAALERIRRLQADGRPLRYLGPATDAAVNAAYANCTFTVYPSLAEGFGLPVLESLSHGKPCVCSARGAIGESARPGGCVTLEAMDAASLASAIARLLESPAELAALATAARRRPGRSWARYAEELRAWMERLPLQK
jgi:glycosyltransferase involved in cell wall biosynthesis